VKIQPRAPNSCTREPRAEDAYIYEERVILVKSDNDDIAIELAEKDAKQYQEIKKER